MTALLANASAEDHAKYLAGNALVCADNIDVLKALPDNSVDLVYLDPPFQSASHYVAVFGDKGQVDKQLKDIWKWTTETERTFQRLPLGSRLLDTLKGIRLQAEPTPSSPMAAYCVFMGRRLLEMRRVLKPTGSIYLHCDYHAAHYLRLLLDAVFGAKNFRNEIVWAYKTGGVSRKTFSRKHDTLFWYTKSGKWRFNPQREKSYTKSKSRKAGIVNYGAGTAQFFKDRFGVYNWVNMRDVWEVSYIGSTHPERLNYPTQKPLALLERIIKASSKPGDLVFDPFCGCGTTVDAAAKLGRRYLGVDVSAIAVRVMEERLASRGGAATPVVYGMDWSEWEWKEFERMALRSRDDAEDGVPGWAWAEDKVAGLLHAIPNSKKTGDGGVDARYFGAAEEVIPIQVKMHRRPVGRPDMQKLLGAQVWMQNQGIYAPMSLMVSLYEPPRNLRTFAAQQGRVVLHGEEYPVMQVLSVEEMLTREERPKLPPVDPRSLVGDTQTRLAMAS